MARKQQNELTAGIFTLLAIVLLIGVVFWLGGFELFKPAGQEACFYVDMDRGLQGLLPGAQVKITDVEVGKIVDVQLDMDERRTYYVVNLFDAETKVYSDAQANVSAALVGGGATLQILDCGGGDDAVPADRAHAAEIQPGMFDKAALMVSKAEAQFDTIGKQVTELLAVVSKEMDRSSDGSAMHKVHAMMDVLEGSLASIRKEMDAGNKLAVIAKLHDMMGHLQAIAKDARPKVSSVLATADTIMKDAEPKMKEILDGAGKLVGGADKLVTGANELVGELNRLTKEDIAKIMKLIHTASEHVVKIGGNFAKLSEGAGALVSVNRENVDEIIDNMGQVADNLKSASKEIRRNPWRLLYRPKKDEERSRNIHDAARSFSNGAAQLDQALAKLKGLAAAHPKGIPAGDPELKKISDQIKETFVKFTDAEKSLWKELLK